MFLLFIAMAMISITYNIVLLRVIAQIWKHDNITKMKLH